MEFSGLAPASQQYDSESVINELLERFGNSIGLPGLAFDDEGICAMTFDNDIEICIRRGNEDQTVSIFSILDDDLPDRPTREWISTVLSMALHPLVNSSLPGIGQHRDLNKLIVYFTKDFSAININSMEDMILSLLNWCRKWRVQP